MATDPKAPTDLMDEPAIENELPTYRAISPMAVTSLFLGICSVLCFADLWFLIAAGLAVVAGIMALVKLRTYADVLTGANLARAGILLATVFSFSSVTVTGVQLALRIKGASEFATVYLEALNSKNPDDALWYRLPPPERRGVSPGEFAARIRKTREPGPYQEFQGMVVKINREAIGPPRKPIKFLRVESTLLDKTTNIAALVYQIQDPAAKGQDPGDDLILVEINAFDSPQRANWFVNNIVYPWVSKEYKPNAKKEAEEKAHGHPH